MNTKLTLKLEEGVIEKAKKYAHNNRQSLSKLVEKFFQSLVEDDPKHKTSMSPTVKSLAGILKEKKELNIEEEYTDYLEKKYS